MEFHKFATAFLFALVLLARVELSVSATLKGYVSCLDCNAHYDLSGIKVQVKCRGVKKLATTTTSKYGSFETELPTNNPTNCQATLLGDSTQLYASKTALFSKIIKTSDTQTYSVDHVLKFYTSCPLPNNKPLCRARGSGLASSLTIGLPIPPEWGLPPSSYFVPFLPIIGIP